MTLLPRPWILYRDGAMRVIQDARAAGLRSMPFENTQTGDTGTVFWFGLDMPDGRQWPALLRTLDVYCEDLGRSLTKGLVKA